MGSGRPASGCLGRESSSPLSADKPLPISDAPRLICRFGPLEGVMATVSAEPVVFISHKHSDRRSLKQSPGSSRTRARGMLGAPLLEPRFRGATLWAADQQRVEACPRRIRPGDLGVHRRSGGLVMVHVGMRRGGGPVGEACDSRGRRAVHRGRTEAICGSAAWMPETSTLSRLSSRLSCPPPTSSHDGTSR